MKWRRKCWWVITKDDPHEVYYKRYRTANAALRAMHAVVFKPDRHLYTLRRIAWKKGARRITGEWGYKE